MDGSFSNEGRVDGLEVPGLETLSYELSFADAPGDWVVFETALHESLSAPYELVLDIATDDAMAEVEDLLGASAALTMNRVSVARQVAGIVTRVDRLGFQTDRLHARLRIVPALRLLAQRIDSRIYQDQTVEQIVTDVLTRGLSAYGRSFRFETGRPQSPRDYCVQYRESDLDFVMRLLQEEGISYFFEVRGETEVMVMVDDNDPLPEVETMDGQAIPIHDGPAPLQLVESMSSFEVVHELRSTATEVIDFDFVTPLDRLHHRVAGADRRGRTREIYEHTRRRQIGDQTEPRAVDALEAATETGQRWKGRSNVCGLAPGHTLVHDLDPDRHYVVTTVRHRGLSDERRLGRCTSAQQTEERYTNEFECVPADVPLRPRPSTPRPMVYGPETAIVTGPPGEEIHTDAHGRIKVHFHWDRLGAYDEGSSCWVRVAQTWAGSGWGSLFIPRVGMEVVVNFLQGNPDRPLVVGCVYNGDNPPPYTLPQDKTKSTLKSNSSTGGDGFNELRFEDLVGSEEIFLHAQKDFNEIALNDHTRQVGNNESIAVAANQSLMVGADRSTQIGANDSLTVGAAQTLSVGADRSATIGGNDSLTVGTALSVSAGATITLSAGAEIVLQAGPSSISMGPAGITLFGPKISLN